MIDIIFNIIFIFLYYLICIWGYIIYNNEKNKKIKIKTIELQYRLKKTLKEEICNMKEEKDINKDKLKSIKDKLKSKNYQKETVKSLLDYKDRKDIIKFIKATNLLDNIFIQKEKDDIDKAYKIYLIGEFKIKQHYNYLIENCQNKSIYIQMNVLKALIRLGDEDYFLAGLKKIMISSSLIHEKVLIDSIYTFNKENKNLNELLMKELKNNYDELNKIIVTHFTKIKYENCKSVLYDILKNKNTNIEVKIACIKYFSHVKYHIVKSLLIELLDDEYWEIRAISASTLKSYKDKDVVLKLRESITDKVWYVRQNSAKSLYSLLKDKDDLMNIINGEDKYASDAILSILSEKEKYEWVLNFNSEEDMNKFMVSNVCC